jgi:hypothetical protein
VQLLQQTIQFKLVQVVVQATALTLFFLQSLQQAVDEADLFVKETVTLVVRAAEQDSIMAILLLVLVQLLPQVKVMQVETVRQVLEMLPLLVAAEQAA